MEITCFQPVSYCSIPFGFTLNYSFVSSTMYMYAHYSLCISSIVIADKNLHLLNFALAPKNVKCKFPVGLAAILNALLIASFHL